jgi:ribokinase
MVDEQAENSIVVAPGANDGVTATSTPAGRVVLAQLEVPVEAVATAFRRARAAGALTILNPAPATELPRELIALSDIIVPNEHEVDLIGGIDALLSAGAQTVIVTRGRRGVTVTTTGNTREPDSWTIPAIEVDAIDTTGAGDAFCGCLAAGLAGGLELPDAVRRAVAAGALATTVRGAVPSLPTGAQMDELLARGSTR